MTAGRTRCANTPVVRPASADTKRHNRPGSPSTNREIGVGRGSSDEPTPIANGDFGRARRPVWGEVPVDLQWVGCSSAATVFPVAGMCTTCNSPFPQLPPFL